MGNRASLCTSRQSKRNGVQSVSSRSRALDFVRHGCVFEYYNQKLLLILRSKASKKQFYRCFVYQNNAASKTAFYIVFLQKKLFLKLNFKTVKTIIFPHLIEKIAFSSVEFNVLSMTKKPTSSDKCFHRLIVFGITYFLRQNICRLLFGRGLF